MSYQLTVPYEAPFDWAHLHAWMRTRALPGVERVDSTSYATALDLPGGITTIRVSDDPVHSQVRVEVDDGAGEQPVAPDSTADVAVRHVVTRLFDLTAHPKEIDGALRRSRVLAPLVEAVPGMRIPGEVTPFAALLRALAGQQVTVASGLAQLYRLVQGCSQPISDGELIPFPTPEGVGAAGFDWYRGPAARRETIRRAVDFACEGGLASDRPEEDVARDLLELRGIGPWTVAYTMMRGFGGPDVDLSGDRALVNAANKLTASPLREVLAECAPWRSYAALHLWRVL